MKISVIEIPLLNKRILLSWMLVICGCVDPISFETTSHQQQPVFFGTFSQLNENHLFYVSKTTDFGDPDTPIGGASIAINDDQGNSALYKETELGLYELEAGALPGIPGRSYQVTISLEDGRTYGSDSQVMPEPIEVEDIYFGTGQKQISGSSGIVEQTFINIYLDTPLLSNSGVARGLRWDVEEVFSYTDLSCHPFFDNTALTCYFQVPIGEPQPRIFKSEGGAQEQLTRFEVHSRLLAPNDEFVEKHYFTVRQYVLTDELFEYWEKVSIVANQSGNLTDPPPAKVSGNIYEIDSPGNFGLGVFEVSGQDLIRIYTLPSMIENDIINTCPIRRVNIVQDKCCFCWLLGGGNERIQRPDYW